MIDERASPEIALLLRCAAGDRAAGGVGATRALAAKITDWRRVFDLSSAHAIVTLVAGELARAGDSIAPAELLALFRASSQRHAMRSLQLTAQLVAAMRTLSAANIEALPFKGPTLAALVYGNFAQRQYEDLDVLVYRSDAERARAALLADGYAPVEHYSPDQRASMRRSGHHEQLVHAQSGTVLELHWSLNTRTMTHDSFEPYWWSERSAVVIGGTGMQTLGAEQLVLYLCMHGGKHSWARLSWLVDLERALITFPAVNWSSIWYRARECGATRMVEIGLTLLEAVLDGAALTEHARAGRARDAEAELIAALIARRMAGGEARETAADFRVQLRSRERQRDRLRYTLHILATPHSADVAALGLPRALHGLYYVLRPLRLVWKYLVRRAPEARAT